MDQKFFKIPFALNGNREEIDNAAQPSGDVSFDLGYTFDYERELGVDPLAKAPERQKMNSLLFQITEALAQYQTVGTPEWITAADNDGVAFEYGIGAAVRYRPNISTPWEIYDSIADANTATPGTDPNKWRVRSPFPAGAMVAFAQAAVPTGWLRCNGQAVSRTTYALLFAAIGTTYGVGDGATTFNVPEIRGEFIRGLDEGRGVDPGRVLGTAQGQALQSHNHYLPTSSGSPPPNSARGINDSAFLNTEVNFEPVVGVQSTTYPNPQYGSPTLVGSVGTFATETRPHNLAFPFCIKV